MAILETVHKRKAAAITTAIGILILCLLFLMGLKYYDPPIEFGMEVNFGTSQQGSGTRPVESSPTTPEPPVEPQPENPTPPQTETSQEAVSKQADVITEDDSPVDIAEKPKKKEEKTPEKKKETPKKVTLKPPPKPKVSKSTKNVLSNFLNSKSKPKESSSTGEGNDRVTGDNGKADGNPYATTYYSSAGKGGQGRGYGLNGRSLQSQGKVVQQCDQEGIVVVRITVNNQGEVIEAVPGVKGSTNTHPCLLKPAKETALLHRWFPDANAPSSQIGFVVIQFKLGE